VLTILVIPRFGVQEQCMVAVKDKGAAATGQILRVDVVVVVVLSCCLRPYRIELRLWKDARIGGVGCANVQ